MLYPLSYGGIRVKIGSQDTTSKGFRQDPASQILRETWIYWNLGNIARKKIYLAVSCFDSKG